LNQNGKQILRRRENKIYNISETEFGSRSSVKYKNSGKLESWKLLTKYKLQYFPKILGVEMPIKGHKHQQERGELDRVFLVSFSSL